MRRLLLTAIAFAAFALPVSAIAANPKADMMQMGRAFAAVKSFHAVMTMTRGTMTMDMILPNTIHATMPQGMEMIAIGSTTWIKTGGAWQKLPMAMPQIGMMADSARNMGMKGKPDSDDYTIEYLGAAMLGSTPAQHYRMISKSSKTPVEMWVGANHLPLQVQTQSNEGPVTIVYSKYNAVAPIAPPM